MRMLIILALAMAPMPAKAAARIAESGRYICADGSSLRFDRRAYGPVLIRDGRQYRLKQRWVFTGFRLSAPDLTVRGRGPEGNKTLTLSITNQPDLACNAVPAGASPGIITGTLTGSRPLPAGSRIIIRLFAPGSTGAHATAEIRPGRRTLPLSWWLAYPASLRTGSLTAVVLDAQGRARVQTLAPAPLPAPIPRQHATATLRLP